MHRISRRSSKKERAFRPLNIAAAIKNHFYDAELFTVSNELGTVTLLSLAVPMLLENIMNSMIGFINSAVLSGYSESAVAATGSAATVINMLAILSIVIANGTGVVISNSIGGNRTEDTYKSCFTALLICGGIGVLISAMMLLLGDWVMQGMNLEGETLAQAVVYFKIRAAFFFVSMISSVLTTILRCYGYSKFTVFSGLLTIVCNLLLNIWVIKFPQYSPLLGVAGIAAGSVISQCVGLLAILLFIKRKHIRFQKPSNRSEGTQYAKRILRIGIPSGISNGAYSLSQVITASFVALLGSYAISAKVYYGNILFYSYLFSMCFGSANSLLVGRVVGAGEIERAKKLNRRLVRITCSVNLIISVGIILLRKPLLSIFTDNPEIIQASLLVFAVDLIAEQARGVSQVYEYALRGVGDMKFMMLVAILSCWLFGVGLSYLLGISLGMGLLGCWIGLAADETVRAVASYARWRKGGWMSLRSLK